MDKSTPLEGRRWSEGGKDVTPKESCRLQDPEKLSALRAERKEFCRLQDSCMKEAMGGEGRRGGKDETPREEGERRRGGAGKDEGSEAIRWTPGAGERGSEIRRIEKGAPGPGALHKGGQGQPGRHGPSKAPKTSAGRQGWLKVRRGEFPRSPMPAGPAGPG